MADELMIPLLPCASIDEIKDFYVPLGFEVTYRQVRPNPYLALRRGGIDLHYFGIEGFRAEDSYGSCMVVVTDTEVLFDAWAAGLRETYGRLPMSGFPRITRPRRRANAGGMSGFSLVDPSGNWIRVTRAAPEPGGSPAGATSEARADADVEPAQPDAAARLARAVENAVVLADSHGDLAQATKILDGALARGADAADLATRIEALAYRAELALRAEDATKATAVLGRIDGETGSGDLAVLPAAVRRTIEQVLAQLDDARSWLRRGDR